MREQVEMVDELRIHIKNRDFHALSELLQGIQPSEVQPSECDAQSLPRHDALLEELEIQTEDLKNEAIRKFDKEEFAYCLETFEFLFKLNPNDRSLKDYLELCKQCTQQQAVSEANRVADSSTQNEPGVRVMSSLRHEGGEQRPEARGSDAVVAKSVGSESAELTRKMRAYFDNRDFEALKRVVEEALRRDSRKSAADNACHRIDSRRLEEEQLKAEFETHVQNLKDEAIRQFQNAAYSECLGTFRFLCELDPANPDLRFCLDSCLKFTQEEASVGGGRLTDRQPHLLNSQLEDQCLVGESAPMQRHVASPSRANKSRKTLGIDDFELALNNGDTLEIPENRPPDASSADTAETSDETQLALNFRMAWLKLGLPALGVLCLLIWLIAPRFGPGLHETPRAEDESGESETVWIEKAESAMTDRRYLTPFDDNVVFYCGRILASDPLNTKAMELKKESLSQVLKQTEEVTNKGRYDEARELYQALLDLPAAEGLNQQDLKASLKKVEFDSYPVIHDHFIGSCNGMLKINSYALVFVSSGGARDGFTERLSRIRLHDPEDTLKLETNHKTYRFEDSSSKNHRDRKEATRRLHRMLRNRMEGTN
jgi:tetratricopeptide (TPR) repeat protein